MIAASASINAAAPGFLEGHLKIGSLSSNIIKPADVLTQTLQECKERTTLHLFKYCQNASENLEKSDGDLCLTGLSVDVARIRSSLWPETTQAPSVSLEVKWEDVYAAQKRTAELHASPQKIEDSVKDH
jgi:hypothetical protein